MGGGGESVTSLCEMRVVSFLVPKEATTIRDKPSDRWYELVDLGEGYFWRFKASGAIKAAWPLVDALDAFVGGVDRFEADLPHGDRLVFILAETIGGMTEERRKEIKLAVAVSRL